MRRVVILVGWAVAAPFAELVEASGNVGEVVDPIDFGPAALERGGFDVVFAVGHPGLDASPERAWGEAIVEFVQQGGGLVASRPATAWFDGWDGWSTLLGAEADPDRDDATLAIEPVRFAVNHHPIVAGLAPILDVGPSPARFRATSAGAVTVMASHRGAPVLWCAARGDGRLVVDTLAYDAESLDVHENRTVLQRAMRWVGEH